MKGCFFPTPGILFAAAVALFVFGSACSKTPVTYDDMVASGTVEKAARKRYSAFFGAVRLLAAQSKDGPDSALVKKAASAADRVIADLRPFPGTVESRIALDALSYAARDLTVSPGFEHAVVSGFREMALLNPIVVVGHEYLRTGTRNASTQIQLVEAFRRGIGTAVTTTLFLDMLSLVGMDPPSGVMTLAEKDTLALRKAADLVIYARSRQPAPPPSWMITGPWVAVFRIPGFYPMFFALVPVAVENEIFLGLRTFEPGEFYSAVFRDPAPDDPKRYDEWLGRAAAMMDSFRVDDSFAERVQTSGLPTWDAHYFYRNYLVSTDADSVRKIFTVSLRRDGTFDTAFNYTGADSLTVVFTTRQFVKPDGAVTTLSVRRRTEASAVNGRTIPAREGAGFAYLMPLGAHDDALLSRMPDIKVEVEHPQGQ